MASPLERLREPVRLVIWDLDETFWSGTLSEGGVRHREDHEAIVIELARRGIMSSICSKNDHAAVGAAFAGREVWNYFIFPQIDWGAKGPKLASLIDAVQLRPASVLFIDDNSLMRNEAEYFVPGIMTADEHAIPCLLDHRLLAGKDDPSLSRLDHYKLLERRHIAARAAPGDTGDFLRESGIRVAIDYDVEHNIDRAIELVNRTNQLNFTKRRLSDDPDTARLELLGLIRNYDIQSGLVRVRDNFGDYGYVGFYTERLSVDPGSGLKHFCFSCRILGMGVETWLYRKLGRPLLEVVGEVVADPQDEAIEIDWITLEDSAQPDDRDDPATLPTSQVSLRGGCEMLAISHYCRRLAADVDGDYAFTRGGIHVRLEHSIMARHAIEPPSPETMNSFFKLGFEPSDFRSRAFESPMEDAIWLLSFWADPVYPLYRHRRTGALIPFNAFPATHPFQDLTKLDPAGLPAAYGDHWIIGALSHLAEEYEPAGITDEALFRDTLRKVFGRMPPGGRAFVLGSNECAPPDGDGIRHVRGWHREMNRWTREIVAEYPRISMIGADEYLLDDADVDTVHGIHADHFARHVYHRIFSIVKDRISNMA